MSEGEKAKTYQAQADELSKQLWAIANDLRGSMDASEFRNYILGTIFYRYLSERTEKYMETILQEDHLTYEQAWENEDYRAIVEDWSIDHLGYIIRPENLYRVLVQKIVKPKNDADKFSVENYERAVNDLISKVITRIDDISFGLEDSQFDVIGRAYMILIGLFASGAGKKAGEFFTPVYVSKLVCTLACIGLDEAKTVGDCSCGSASMLLEVQKHLGKHKVGHFYGQEYNSSTYNMARMNMLMHGIDYQSFDIYRGDTIKDDHYGQDLKLTVQVENPPYSLKYDANPQLLDDPRYSGAGVLPPKSHADLAFVEHMIYHMDPEDGRIAVLLPHGVLFRGGAEDKIRRYIIKDRNLLDAVIGLAPNLFHGTSIPVCLLILKSNRNGNSGNILFIDASKDFVKGKAQNSLSDANIDKIVSAYKERKDVDKFAHVAPMSEIEANDYNLNIPRYVNTAEEEEEIDIETVLQNIADTQKEIRTQTNSIEETLGLLGVKLPEGL